MIESEVMRGMHVSPEYAWTAVLLSVGAVLLAGWYLKRVIHTYRIHHDHRAAVALAKALGLGVIAIGLVVSASGLVIHTPELSIVGLSLARGAIIVLLATLVLADVRP